jgi:hypothetical protein
MPLTGLHISPYGTREFTLEFTTGCAFPEGGDKHGWCVPDLCDECVPKLLTLLEAEGIVIAEIEEYW